MWFLVVNRALLRHFRCGEKCILPYAKILCVCNNEFAEKSYLSCPEVQSGRFAVPAARYALRLVRKKSRMSSAHSSASMPFTTCVLGCRASGA